jgi:16S rRNA (guanine966-N2)-methyltransferase
MRIISGACRGRKLSALRGMVTRPTADRVRESIFNILAPHVSGAHVLDLFAGTGAMGLEALSRGAAAAVLVDSSAQAIQIIEKNILACKMENRSRSIRWDILKNLHCLKPQEPAFDLVFMDPPYAKGCIQPALTHLIRHQVLKTGAMIVIEHAPAEPVPENFNELKKIDQRVYGKTLVSFLTVVLETS